MGNKGMESEKKKATTAEFQTYIMIVQAKLTQQRNKKVMNISKVKREIITLLNDNNLEIAKLKMEAIIRDENMITVHDIMGPLCEILKERVTYLMFSDKCPDDVRATLDTVVYASSRIEIEELHKIRDIAKELYGGIYLERVNNNTDGLVNVNVLEKLKLKPPSEPYVVSRLKQLCKEENCNFVFPQEITPLITNSYQPITTPTFNSPNVIQPIDSNNQNNFNNPYVNQTHGLPMNTVGVVNTYNNQYIEPKNPMSFSNNELGTNGSNIHSYHQVTPFNQNTMSDNNTNSMSQMSGDSKTTSNINNPYSNVSTGMGYSNPNTNTNPNNFNMENNFSGVNNNNNVMYPNMSGGFPEPGTNFGNIGPNNVYNINEVPMGYSKMSHGQGHVPSNTDFPNVSHQNNFTTGSNVDMNNNNIGFPSPKNDFPSTRGGN